MNTQKRKWVFAEGALGQHEVLAARKVLREIEMSLKIAHRAWRVWVLNRDAGGLTTHALHNEGARWRRMIRDLRQDLRKAQEHYFSVATINPFATAEIGLKVECPFGHMQEAALQKMVACSCEVDSTALSQAQHAYLKASGWATERMADDSLRYKYLTNYSMPKAQALHVEMQRTRTMADPTLTDEMHAAERQMLLDCGWVEVGVDAWVSSDFPDKEPKNFGHAVNTVEADPSQYAERRKATRSLVHTKRLDYLLGNGWTTSDLSSNLLDPTTGRAYSLKKAVNRQKFFTSEKRVFREAATPEQRAVAEEMMQAEDQYLLDRGWARMTRCRYSSRASSPLFRPEAMEVQLAIDAGAGFIHGPLVSAQIAYLLHHRWQQTPSGLWRRGKERKYPLSEAVGLQQFTQWQYNRLVGGVQ